MKELHAQQPIEGNYSRKHLRCERRCAFRRLAACWIDWGKHPSVFGKSWMADGRMFA